MITIESFRSALTLKLNDLSDTYGEQTALNEDEVNLVSAGIDEVNETVNPNLPPRP